MEGISSPMAAIEPTLPSMTSIAPNVKPPSPLAAKVSQPAQPAINSDRRLKNGAFTAKSKHTTITPYQQGSITYVSRMAISLSSKRVGFLTPQSMPLRGSVNTDLTVGVYSLSVDRTKQQWIFEAGKTKAGLRFDVELDGPDPFNFDYPDTVSLIVQEGLPPSGTDSYKAVKATLKSLASPGSGAEAYQRLSLLNEVDLYDIIDEMWSDNQQQEAISALVLLFPQSSGLDLEERLRILRALESFTEPDKTKLYVDNFDKCYVNPNSFQRADSARVRAGLWSMKLTFVYMEGGPTQRFSDVYIDDILSDTSRSGELPQYGTGALLRPRYLTAGTCPRMYAAKLAMIDQVENQNFAFIFEAYKAVQDVLSLVMAGGDAVGRLAYDAVDVATITQPVASRTKINFNATIKALIDDERGAGRLITPKAPESATLTTGTQRTLSGIERQSPEFIRPEPSMTGEWRFDFEGGLNQRASDAEYVVRSTKVPGNQPNLHFFFNNTRFDGALDAMGNPAANGTRPFQLIECKNWQDGGMYSRILTRKWDSPSGWIRMQSQIEQAEQLVQKADGIPLVYHVNSETNARLLDELLRKTWGLDIQEVKPAIVKLPK